MVVVLLVLLVFAVYIQPFPPAPHVRHISSKPPPEPSELKVITPGLKVCRVELFGQHGTKPKNTLSFLLR